MKRVILMLTVASALAVSSCNHITKNYGGSMTIDLPKGEKLINATWKDDDLWYMTRSMSSIDSPETYKFAEKSNYGILQGSVTIHETR